MKPKYPNIEVKLSGEDGNALAVIGAVAKAMRRAGLTQNQIVEFRAEAMGGDYDHVLQTCMRTVNVT